MSRYTTNISTEYQPKGSGRNPSDTLDRRDEETAKPASRGDGSSKAGSAPLVDEKYRPLSGDGTLADSKS